MHYPQRTQYPQAILGNHRVQSRPRGPPDQEVRRLPVIRQGHHGHGSRDGTPRRGGRQARSQARDQAAPSTARVPVPGWHARLIRGCSQDPIQAPSAGITNRVGRFHRTPGTAVTYRVAGNCTSTGSNSGSGLDLLTAMFAPRLLGRPGTGWQDAVLTSLRLVGLRYSSARHSIPVTQVF